MAASESRAQLNEQADSFYESDESPMTQIDFQDYLRTLRKHKWLIILFSGVVSGLAGYYAYTATPIYQSTSTLLIESQGNNLVQFEELVGLNTENQDYYQTQFELLRSRGLAVRVLNHMNLWNHPELSPEAMTVQQASETSDTGMGDSAKSVGTLESLVSQGTTFIEGLTNNAGSSEVNSKESVLLDLAEPTARIESSDIKTEDLGRNFGSGVPSQIELNLDRVLASDQTLSADRQRVIDNFMQKLTITPVRKTKLVKLSFESNDPRLAALVANTTAEQYIESYLDAKLELTTKASRWLNERLGDLKGVLEASENRLIGFKQANGLVDVDGSVGRLNEQELLLATAELAQARSELATQSDLFREVQAVANNPSFLESIPAVQADPLVQRVKIEQGQAQRALDELRNRYGDRHPRVVDANSQLLTLNSTLEGHLRRVAGNISKDYQLARQRVSTIEGKLAAGKREIQSLGTKKFELDELEREVQTNREIYNTFFSRITEASSADGLETANARISDAAVPALTPIKPKKQLIIALAALTSLVLSMLMAILYEQMDDTVKSTKDVEGKLGLNLLGILPLVKGGMFSKKRSLPLNPLEIPDTKNRFAESVNTVRTALCLDDGRAVKKVMAVTSSVPGEGKSSTSINIAFSLGQLERVLLIDCDLRRPTIAKAAGLDKNTAGLSSLITKAAPASECIKRGVFGGSIDILPSGPIPDQPLELLSSKRFESIVSQLSEHYDRIIIDCAPTQAVSDALVISRVTDAIIYCVKSHDTTMDLIRRGVQRLKQAGAPLAGVVITQVDIDKITSYGGDYYYQGYYDYYGYTEKGESKQRTGGKLRLTKEELHGIRTDEEGMDLDLDYMSSNRTPMRNDSPIDIGSYDDLDETAQFDFDSGRAKSKNGRMSTDESVHAKSSKVQSRRMRGDLDIL